MSRRGRHKNGVGLFVTFDGDLPLQQSGRRTQLFVRQGTHQLALFFFHKVGHNRGDFSGLGIPQLNREGLSFVGFQRVELLNDILHQIEILRGAGDQQGIGSTINRDGKLLTFVGDCGEVITQEPFTATEVGTSTNINRTGINRGTTFTRLEHVQIARLTQVEQVYQNFTHGGRISVHQFKDSNALCASTRGVQIRNHSYQQRKGIRWGRDNDRVRSDVGRQSNDVPQRQRHFNRITVFTKVTQHRGRTPPRSTTATQHALDQRDRFDGVRGGQGNRTHFDQSGRVLRINPLDQISNRPNITG